MSCRIMVSSCAPKPILDDDDDKVNDNYDDDDDDEFVRISYLFLANFNNFKNFYVKQGEDAYTWEWTWFTENVDT